MVAVLRDRCHASEILVSLMLVYVAEMFLSYLVYGPWKDPAGHNFPQTITFLEAARVPRFFTGLRMNWGLPIALLAVAGFAIFLFRSFAGFQGYGVIHLDRAFHAPQARAPVAPRKLERHDRPDAFLALEPDLPAGHRFPMRKYSRLRERLADPTDRLGHLEPGAQTVFVKSVASPGAAKPDAIAPLNFR